MIDTRGITLITLIITIIVLVILAGISIAMLTGENGILTKSQIAIERTKKENAIEKVKTMLADYQIEKLKGNKTLEAYMKEQKEKEELEEVINNNDGTITVEVDGYEITIDEESLTIIRVEEANGIKPIFEIQETKVDGTDLEGRETQKAITINISNLSEFGENYSIEVEDSNGNNIKKEEKVIGNLIGQASFIINRTGSYTIKVIGIKDGISKIATKTQEIKLTMQTIEEAEMFSKANGIIDIVWLDMQNNVIDNPISPKEYLSGLTAIKHNGEDWVLADEENNQNDWYDYREQVGINDTKTSVWANARSEDSNAYFVWIPRYAYKITYFDTPENAEAYRKDDNEIGIVGYSTIEGMIDMTTGIPKLVKESEPKNVDVTKTVKNVNYAEYIPHPAFEFDGVKAGIWVGKYESSGSASNVTIVPNKGSFRNLTIGKFFTISQNVRTMYNLIGDSHLMKNVEWGSVAYLTESRYGRNGIEVTMNQNYTTGGGNYIENAEQSTTGNIYGVYDLNGTSWEYVAGILSSKLSNGSNYDFTNVDSKYYDSYDGYNVGMKGDAIYETSEISSGSSGWHQDASDFLKSDVPAFRRGRIL